MSDIDIDINNSLHLARKYARIFVFGHYRFREANSFPRAKLEENCELRGTNIVQGQISVHIFEAKWIKYIFFLQGRILGDLSKKICQRSNIISLLKVFSFIHLYDLLGIKAKRAKVNRRVPKLGNIICYYSTKSRDAHIWSESHCYSYCWLSTILYQRRAHGIIDKL